MYYRILLSTSFDLDGVKRVLSINSLTLLNISETIFSKTEWLRCIGWNQITAHETNMIYFFINLITCYVKNSKCCKTSRNQLIAFPFQHCSCTWTRIAHSWSIFIFLQNIVENHGPTRRAERLLDYETIILTILFMRIGPSQFVGKQCLSLSKKRSIFVSRKVQNKCDSYIPLLHSSRYWQNENIDKNLIFLFHLYSAIIVEDNILEYKLIWNKNNASKDGRRYYYVLSKMDLKT